MFFSRSESIAENRTNSVSSIASRKVGDGGIICEANGKQVSSARPDLSKILTWKFTLFGFKGNDTYACSMNFAEGIL
ncbi:hypothetical protein LIER_14472 [Lithospermum erythrorhizon]|uniref:Uncharacterized protein n=1 Tax=Lithospermum erythrorhizon TaxID=34254 RepID=A0AAV3Q3W6_LITER